MWPAASSLRDEYGQFLCQLITVTNNSLFRLLGPASLCLPLHEHNPCANIIKHWSQPNNVYQTFMHFFETYAVRFQFGLHAISRDKFQEIHYFGTLFPSMGSKWILQRFGPLRNSQCCIQFTKYGASLAFLLSWIYKVFHSIGCPSWWSHIEECSFQMGGYLESNFLCPQGKAYHGTNPNSSGFTAALCGRV